MTYSLDFRKKVLAVKKRDGLSFEDVALRFDIGSKHTVFRWTKQPEPCATQNKPVTKIDMDDVATLNRTHPLKYLKRGVFPYEPRKT